MDQQFNIMKKITLLFLSLIISLGIFAQGPRERHERKERPEKRDRPERKEQPEKKDIKQEGKDQIKKVPSNKKGLR